MELDERAAGWLGELEGEPYQFNLFKLVIEEINNKQLASPTMLELGAGIGQFSKYYNENVLNGRNICLEIQPTNCNIIRKLIPDATIYEGYVGQRIHMRETIHADMVDKKIFIKDIFEENNIDNLDLLHIDIQGGEVAVLQELVQSNLLSKIDYMFISTHRIKRSQVEPNWRVLHDNKGMTKEGFELFEKCQGDTYIPVVGILHNQPVNYEWLFQTHLVDKASGDGLVVVKRIK
tara:strand:- start:184 stop:885 length:702 start_codon:yes stop_codon:yes gene_type:complete